MLEIWMDHNNETKVRKVTDKQNQQFETMTYPALQYNSGCSHFLLFLCNHQDKRMLEIWMDDDNNDIKVRMVADKSYQHLKEWLTLKYSYAALAAHTSYCSWFPTKILAC